MFIADSLETIELGFILLLVSMVDVLEVPFNKSILVLELLDHLLHAGLLGQSGLVEFNLASQVLNGSLGLTITVSFSFLLEHLASLLDLFLKYLDFSF